jgi:tubby-related protein 1
MPGLVCRAFLAQPGPATGPLQCFIVRSRGAAKLYPRYSLYLDVGHKFLMAARKRKKARASNYVMSLDETVRGMQTQGSPPNI